MGSYFAGSFIASLIAGIQMGNGHFDLTKSISAAIIGGLTGLLVGGIIAVVYLKKRKTNI